jgi:DNA polymerase delta subunit 2
MLEDESGRLRLTGTLLQSSLLVTGAIVAALGTENADGDFEVIDTKVPDLPPQPKRWERDPGLAEAERRKGGSIEGVGDNAGRRRKKIAFVSGLGISGCSGDTLALSLLTDYLLGYVDTDNQHNRNDDANTSSTSAAQITRLIIAGNSLGSGAAAHPSGSETPENGSSLKKKRQAPKKYGYDASSYNPSPVNSLDTFLAEILPSIPVTLMPGENDPANFSIPQQEIHRAMLPRARAYCSAVRPEVDNSPTDIVEPGWLDNVTNPWEGDVEGWRFWGCSGQNVDDILRYMDLGAEENGNGEEGDGDVRLRVMEAMLRWRCAVPTAPDTLCTSNSLSIPVCGLLSWPSVNISISQSQPCCSLHPTHITCQGVILSNPTILLSSNPARIFSLLATSRNSKPLSSRAIASLQLTLANRTSAVSACSHCRSSTKLGSWCWLMRRRWRWRL